MILSYEEMAMNVVELVKKDLCIDGVPLGEALERGMVKVPVFCKDCKHRDPEDHKCDCGKFERIGCRFPVDDNYFCAYGEK